MRWGQCKKYFQEDLAKPNIAIDLPLLKHVPDKLNKRRTVEYFIENPQHRFSLLMRREPGPSFRTMHLLLWMYKKVRDDSSRPWSPS